jgi:hypothetical protein
MPGVADAARAAADQPKPNVIAGSEEVVHPMHTTHDPLVQAARLAADYGLRLDPYALADSTAEAGTLRRPERSEHDLSRQGVAACDLLLRETARSAPLCGDGGPDLDAVLRLRMLARIVSMLLPPVVGDYAGRYSLRPGPSGYIPDAFDLDVEVRQHAARLAAYIAEHDAGEWVDPYAVAGAVADLHDTVRLMEALATMA